MEFDNGKDDIRHIVKNKSSMVLVSIYLQIDLQTWVILGDFSGISGRFCDPEMIGEWEEPCGFMKQSLEMRQTMGLRNETWELDQPNHGQIHDRSCYVGPWITVQTLGEMQILIQTHIGNPEQKPWSTYISMFFWHITNLLRKEQWPVSTNKVCSRA